MNPLEPVPKKIAGTDGYDYGFGQCEACKKDVRATMYWRVPNVVYRVGKIVHGNLFTLGHNRPFCDTFCALTYYEKLEAAG